jgi:hypothetical protein
MLLGELDGTKKEMQELQSKYNAFRVSRVPFLFWLRQPSRAETELCPLTM